MKERILVCWLGHTDLRALACASGGPAATPIRNPMGQTATGTAVSPIKVLVDQQHFSQVHLLSNMAKGAGAAFAKWLGDNVEVHNIALKDPTHYPTVYEAAKGVLEEITEPMRGSAYELCMHLSPGTPTMAAIWVLLGKSLFPATFYQTHEGKAKSVDIPFDINVDYLPELYRRRQAAIEEVMSHPTPVGFENIIGGSREMKVAIDRARRAAAFDVGVLILGESGTGKELFARAIHDSSARRGKPFLAINCAAIPRELLESELFGHRKGGFTGATADRKGAFEQANEGTLFLDEIGECDPAMQVKLLRVLQPPAGKSACTRVFTPVGGARDAIADVRLIAATNRSLADEVQRGGFRLDLYYRLAAVSIQLPALRARGADVVMLAEKLLEGINADFRRQMGALYKDKTLTGGALACVRAYRWPGNVREMHNVLTQAVVMANGESISRADLESAVGATPAPRAPVADGPIPEKFNLTGHLEEIQRAYLARAMEQAGGVKTKAAALLGMANYQTLDAQLQRLGVGLARSTSSGKSIDS